MFSELTATEIKRLGKRKEVATIFLHEPEGILALSTSMAIVQFDKVQSNLSITGSGVNVAVYEDGPDDTRCSRSPRSSRRTRRPSEGPSVDVELDAVALAKLVDSLPIDCTLVKEVLVAALGLNESEVLVGS
jgi:hypothetical protein